MAKFTVTIEQWTTDTWVVEAETEEEAEYRAFDEDGEKDDSRSQYRDSVTVKPIAEDDGM